MSRDRCSANSMLHCIKITNEWNSATACTSGSFIFRSQTGKITYRSMFTWLTRTHRSVNLLPWLCPWQKHWIPYPLTRLAVPEHSNSPSGWMRAIISQLITTELCCASSSKAICLHWRASQSFFFFFFFVYFLTRVSSLKLRAMLIGEFVQISPSFVGQVVCFLLSTRPVAKQTRGKRSHRPMPPPRTWSVPFALCHGAPCCQHTRQFGSSWSNTCYRSLGGKKKDKPNSCWRSWAAILGKFKEAWKI